MSSLQGVQPAKGDPSNPKGVQPKGVQPRPKGVQPKKSDIVKRLPTELRETFAAAAPSLLRPVHQPFQGIPVVKPLLPSEEKRADAQQANPLLHPDSSALKKKKSLKPSAVKPMVAASAASPPSKLRLVQRTVNMVERDRSDVLDPQVEMDLDEIDPLFAEFRERQDETESENPYQLETEIYTPITRRTFYKFIHDSYSESFKILPRPKGPIDENACQTIEESKRLGVVEAFSYQKFIAEYLRQASPFRGLLVYHGLGSGKTCSAIAAAEALYGTANKRIIVMTPFSLRPNFISEISFCGFRHFNVNNHWVAQPISTEYESAPVYMYGRDILSLPEKFLDGVLRREEERRVIWIPDFDKPANFYDDEQITSQQRIDIRQQINAAVENRITFISYNGIPGNKLKEYACTTDENGNKFFDNAVIVIDEIHNLIRLMQGNIVPYITKRSGRARKIPVEPIVPGRWKPGLCDRPANYKRAYLFYRLLSDARNSKIIGLSGTPIINFPEELGILANVLAGYTECAKFVVDTTDEDDLDAIKELCEEEPRVDIVRYEKSDRKTEFLVSVFNEGYLREEGKDQEGESYVGVQYSEEEEAQEGIQAVFPRIKQAITEQGLASIVSEQYISYPRLPVDDESFRREFINPVDLSIRNRLVLQKRITGLISYYAANNEAFMPRVAKDELVRCEMSDYVLSKYSQARKAEMEGEANKKKEPGDVFSAVEMFAKMKNPSSYRFRSRALCNFAFPESIERPFPGTQVEEEEADALELGEAELAEIIEIASADPLNDTIAVEEVMREEELVEDPEEAEPQAQAQLAPQAQPPPQEKQEGGAGEDAKPVVKRPMTAAQARARLEALRAAQAQAQAEEAKAQEPLKPQEEKEVAPSESKPIKKVFGAPSAEEPKPIKRFSVKPPVLEEPLPVPAVVASLAPAEPIRIKKVFGPSEEKQEPKLIKRFSIKPPVLEKPLPVPSASLVPAEPAAPAAPAEPVRIKKVFGPSEDKQEVKPIKRFSVKPPVLAKPLPVPEPQEPEPQEPEPQEAAVPAKRLIPYKELIQMAMRDLEEKKNTFLNLESSQEEGRLALYSTKLDRMLRNILQSKGSNLVYSQFKTVEGLGVLGLALKANGFQEIVVQGSDADPYFSPETVESFRKGPATGEKRFILFTGEGSKDRRGLILNIFNGNLDKLPQKMQSVFADAGYAEEKNIRGAICWVIGITGAGAEGISLKCCRSVHIMESYWNNVRLDQVKGRAIRICSHTDLPYQERDVDIYTYCTVFSEEQKRSKIDITLKVTDNNETSDERVYNVGIKKDKINQAILQVMKEAAVDCGLNSADIGDVQCLRIDGRPDQYLFDPDLEVDKRITGIQFKQVQAQKVPQVQQDLFQGQEQKDEAIQKALSQPSKPSKVSKMEVQMIRYDGKPYLLLPYPTDKERFKLYSPLDELFRKQLGELEFDPITKRPSRVFFYPEAL